MFPLFFILFFFPFSSAAICPQNGIKWQSKCYIFATNLSAFITAEIDCVNSGGHLASIHDGFTNAFVAQESMLQFHGNTTSDVWIGATTFMNPGNWSWTDGTNFTFSQWNNSSMPLDQRCGALSTLNGMWNSVDCYKEKPYVCAITDALTTTTKLTTTSTTRISPTTPLSPFCPNGWKYFNFTLSCYIKTPKQLDWSSAEEYCQAFGGHLISIHSQNEFNFYYNDYGMFGWNWIGLFSSDNMKTWKWSDESVLDYTNWAQGYPTTIGYPCVNAATSFKSDQNCMYVRYGVCKKSGFLHP
jgi:C-type mannose receptor